MKSKCMFLIICLVFTGVIAQPLNLEVNANGSTPHLIGKINKAGLTTNSYAEWFVKNYDDYVPEEAIIEQLKDELPEFTIEFFMGTWCGDSKREVPRFYKILEASGFPMQRLTAVAVDRKGAAYKQSPGGEHESKNIHRVPTFIFYKNGIEVNRITERPVSTLEGDMLNIARGNYVPNYFGVSRVNDVLTEFGPSKFAKKVKKLLPEISAQIKNKYELNTFAAVLYAADSIEEALAIFKLNTQLFPNEVSTYLSLANTLGVTGNRNEAILNYEKVLSIQPENEEARSGIDHLRSKNSN